jgi:hypothetical protein
MIRFIFRPKMSMFDCLCIVVLASLFQLNVSLWAIIPISLALTMFSRHVEKRLGL